MSERVTSEQTQAAPMGPKPRRRDFTPATASQRLPLVTPRPRYLRTDIRELQHG
ncbi:MAG: hypothetical protein MOGMAGMI_02475 [Candidatus Omnitrophica bacterium]|nr:hypothetical protein [Candidatus Omnitrophota bacterium]